MLKSKYSNYFCQKLFLNLSKPIRLSILESLLSNLFKFMNSNEGIYSLIFILENGISLEEQEAVVNSLISKMYLYFCYQKFYRILECVVSCFDHEICSNLIRAIVDNTLNIITTKEGFFLFKALVCSVKSASLQLEIVEKFKLIFPMLVDSYHGSLVLKHLVESFSKSKFVYVKYFSKFLNAYSKRKAQYKIVKEYDNRYLSTKALEAFHLKVFEYVSSWDRKNLIIIVDFSLKNCQVFQTLLLSQIQKRDVFSQLMRLEIADKILAVVGKSIISPEYADVALILKQFLLTTNIEKPNIKSVLHKLIFSKEKEKKQMQHIPPCYIQVEGRIPNARSFYQAPPKNTVMLISAQNMPYYIQSSNFIPNQPFYSTYPNTHSYYSNGKDFNDFSRNGFNN